MKNWILILFFATILIINTSFKFNDTINIDGLWQVFKHQNCLNDNIDDTLLLNEFNITEKECLKDQIEIKNNKIYSISKNTCGFLKCDSLRLSELTPITEKDTLLFYPYNRCNVIVKDTVVNNFINKLYKKDGSLTFYNTNCLCDWEDYTYKIIIINNNQIVLLSAIDIIILNRIK